MMACKTLSVRRLLSSAFHLEHLNYPGRLGRFYLDSSRCFHASAGRRTDGVFHGLSDNRLATPWIEALRAQHKERDTGVCHEEVKDRDLSPKKMSDSYHRVILPLGRDPWLSDTYINASGHIRCDLPTPPIQMIALI